MIYIALIRTEGNHPLKLIVRDDLKEMKEYLLAIPAVYAVQNFATYDTVNKVMCHYTLRDLVEFLKD